MTVNKITSWLEYRLASRHYLNFYFEIIKHDETVRPTEIQAEAWTAVRDGIQSVLKQFADRLEEWEATHPFSDPDDVENRFKNMDKNKLE